jgi:NAD(P)-dependent dehydrogenase (short-subunit alcohol dehydrogenase family)
VLRDSLEVNLFGAVYLCEQLIPAMRARGWGRIINIASTAGMNGALELVSYATSKGALIAFTKALAVEFAGEGIAINAVAPGPVVTSNYRRLKGESRHTQTRITYPNRTTGRAGKYRGNCRLPRLFGFLSSHRSGHRDRWRRAGSRALRHSVGK